MAGPNDQDKLSDTWAVDDTTPVNGTTQPPTEAEVSAEWAAMLEGDGGAGRHRCRSGPQSG